MTTLGPGDRFPHVVLPDLEGIERPLAEAWSAGPALVLIGHRDCKTTRQTLPYVNRLFERKGTGASVAVILQDDAATARGLVGEQGYKVPVLLEAEPYPVAAELGITAVPTLFAVARGGRIEKVVEGFDRKALEAFTAPLGVSGALFAADDRSPAYRPG